MKSRDRLNRFFDIVSEELSHHGGKSARRQRERLRKKGQLGDKTLRGHAINRFLETNRSIAGYICTLDPEVESNARDFVYHSLERYALFLDGDSIQESMIIEEVLSSWRYGPGASYEVKGTHTAEKIATRPTSTLLCRTLVANLRNGNPYFASYDALQNWTTNVVRGSKLTTVPKNESTDRTIAIEPSGNMMLQLSVATYLENVLRKIGLDIRRQQVLNKELARLGSIHGHIATIDLSMASDMITPDLVRRLMPPEWFELLWRLRSPEVQIDGEWHTLNMMSTMGCGFTFPLMTFLLVALIYGTAVKQNKIRRPHFIDWNTYAVFGDDIIVPVDLYAPVCETLEQAGLIVNHDKSFSTGTFRESCGGDFDAGEDITPFYVKSLSNDPEIYVAINQVLEWSAKNNIFLFRSLAFLKEQLRSWYLVPEWAQDYSGVRTAICGRRYKYLQKSVIAKRLSNEHFVLPLAIGGYINSHGGTPVYTSRESRVVYRGCRSRLPRGYLDGGDPLSRAAIITSRVSLIVDILTTE